MVIDDNIDECVAYYRESELKYLNMKDRISLRLEQNMQSHYDEKDNVRVMPDDSVRQIQGSVSKFPHSQRNHATFYPKASK